MRTLRLWVITEYKYRKFLDEDFHLGELSAVVGDENYAQIWDHCIFFNIKKTSASQFAHLSHGQYLLPHTGSPWVWHEVTEQQRARRRELDARWWYWRDFGEGTILVRWPRYRALSALFPEKLVPEHRIKWKVMTSHGNLAGD